MHPTLSMSRPNDRRREFTRSIESAGEPIPALPHSRCSGPPVRLEGPAICRDFRVGPGRRRTSATESDTVGEFPKGLDWPESGQTGMSCEGECPAFHTSAEFANSIESAGEPLSGTVSSTINDTVIGPTTDTGGTMHFYIT